jgi:polyphosphate kinase
LFTSDKRLTSEVARVFNFLETVKLPQIEFEHLLVGQFNLRSSLIGKIEREIVHANNGKNARMILKMNSLEDREMIAKLYEASNAGVQIDLIIRGICCIVPGKKGFSENIKVISIVDRFLEHARVFWFQNDGNDEMYLSSADFMRRNLSYRIETAFPIYNTVLRKDIKAVLDVQLLDNVKARIVNEKLENKYYKSGDDMSIRAQVETYYRLKRKTESN